ncbi:MAG: ArsR/SmtB family transcription factor [Pseudomonadota bacterium]
MSLKHLSSRVRPAGDDESVRLARAFRALSNPNRLQIYTEILRRQRSALGPEHSCALYDFINSLEIGAPTVSHHIKELVAAGLISVERDGKYLACSLDEGTRRTLAAFFADVARA